MTTTQAAANGHRVFPPPRSVEHLASLNGDDVSTDKANISSNPLPSQISDLPSPDAPPPFTPDAYHVPPARFAPKPNAYRQDDTLDLPPDTTPLPDRCQFMFSDGRQCTMARSDIHPSLCRFHAEREDQLFGDPAPGGAVVGRGLDLPELYSACADLSTAAGVSRALAQVFRLLAQRRISRQEAATFGHLAQLLLQSIRAARTDAPNEYHQRETSPQFLPHRELSAGRFEYGARANATAPVILNESALADESKDLSASVPARPNLSEPQAAAFPEPPSGRFATSNSPKINTSVASSRNSPEISTSKNAGLYPHQNQHLQRNATGAQAIEAPR